MAWRERLGDLVAARTTLAVLALLVVIQLGVAIAGGPHAVAGLYHVAGLSLEGMALGRVWQLLSYALLHGDGFHLLLNGIGLLLLGAGVERIGRGRWVLLLLVAGVLIGALCHLALVPDPERILVGISGGVAALLLWLTGLAPEARVRGLPLSAGNLGRGMLIASGGLALLHPQLGVPGLSALGEALTAILGEGLFSVSHACHFGGGVAGWVGARWVLRPRVSLARLRRERARRERRAG